MGEIKVGMTVYLKPTGANNTRRLQGSILDHVIEAKVSKVGRKYFYVEGRVEKYDLETMQYDSEQYFDMKAYLTLQEIKDEIEVERLESKIRAVFNRYGKTGLTLTQLRAIDKIITKEG